MELFGITMGRGTRRLAQALSLSMTAGEVLHLTGPNGIGKTTLLEIAAGLRHPWAGTVRHHAASHWLGHRNALSGNLTAVQNLTAWAGLQHDIAVPAAEALMQMGVLAAAHRLCRQLSVGQRRRAALARLLMAPRPIWILDEPLDGLDRDGLGLFARLMNQHTASGGAILVTSHQALPRELHGVREETLRA